MVEVLLKHKANVNLTDSQGNTALHSLGKLMIMPCWGRCRIFNQEGEESKASPPLSRSPYKFSLSFVSA